MSTAEATTGLPNETENDPQNPVEVVYLDARALILSDMTSLLTCYVETGLDEHIPELVKSDIWIYDNVPGKRNLGVGIHIKEKSSDPHPDNGVRFEVFTPDDTDDEVEEVVVTSKRPWQEAQEFHIKPSEDIGPQPPAHAIEVLDFLDRELLRTGARF